MQTDLTAEILQTPQGQRADEIFRKCVHCGFCTATCPTYQLLGDELDGPRGRIYQIKQLLEGQPADREVLSHLDRCLTCRSCETTCPSGVNYAELIDIGRFQLEQEKLRPWWQQTTRLLLGQLLPYPSRNRLLFKLSSMLRPILPRLLKQKTPRIRKARNYQLTEKQKHQQKTVLLLEGCVQSTLSPNTNAAAEFVLSSLGYHVIREPSASCCGAVNQHLSQAARAEQWVLKNLQRWQQLDDSYALDAIVSTATGCGVMLKDYPIILGHTNSDSNEYRELTAKIRDISELFDAETLTEKNKTYQASQHSIAFHAPCTLTHGHRLADRLFNELSKLGYQLNKPRDAHLCCGSAGTYSLLQPGLSKRLRDNKLQALLASVPEFIITANVGCEHHLNSANDTEVIHWIELVANDLAASA